MLTRLQRSLALLALTAALVVSTSAGTSSGIVSTAQSLPGRLSDAEFWKLVTDFSEPNGFFDSDNLLSNETTFQYVIPRLKSTVKSGGAYLGVGPEQNFPYMIALEPKIAFIVDIRRGNLHEHLMYKALLEMSADRAEFLSLLFSRKRPAGLGPESSVQDLLGAYERVEPSEELYKRNLQSMNDWLTRRHGFALQPDDLPGVQYVYSSFFAEGPFLSYNSSRPQRYRYPTYSELQRETDGQGQNRGYLASEANFRIVKRLEESNLVVPLVGDFAGSKALRAVAGYLNARGAVVSAFYTSNVENYLFQSGAWGRFAQNVAALPIDSSSTFIRACFDSCASVPGSRSTTLLDPIAVLLKDFNEGKVRTYRDVLAHSR
jgi:hypothetical protein